jgi:hypothetical protein
VRCLINLDDDNHDDDYDGDDDDILISFKYFLSCDCYTGSH